MYKYLRSLKFSSLKKMVVLHNHLRASRKEGPLLGILDILNPIHVIHMTIET